MSVSKESEKHAAEKRLRTAFELYEVAENIMRQNLRRRNPRATDEEIEEGLRRWLAKGSEPVEDSRLSRPESRS